MTPTFPDSTILERLIALRKSTKIAMARRCSALADDVLQQNLGDRFLTRQDLEDKLGSAMFVISCFEKLLHNRSVWDFTEVEQAADWALDDFRRWWGNADKK